MDRYKEPSEENCVCGAVLALAAVYNKVRRAHLGKGCGGTVGCFFTMISHSH